MIVDERERRACDFKSRRFECPIQRYIAAGD